MNRPSRKKWRVNVRALIILGIILGIGLPTFAVWNLWQNWSGRSVLLHQAEIQMEADPPRPDLALIYLTEYLKTRPNDPVALEKKAKILADSAQLPEHLESAIALNEHALRLAPEAPHSQEIRRRLVELYLRLGMYVGADNVQLQTAESIARDLIERDGKKANAQSLRLLGEVLELQFALGKDQKVLDEAITFYERAHQADPHDITIAESLAWAYEGQRKPPQPSKAAAVLDALLKAEPTAATRLARFRHNLRAELAETDPDAKERYIQQAAEELRQAVALAPDDTDVLLTAAEFALQNHDTDEARRYYDRIAGTERDTLRARLIRGLIEMAENQTDNAIESWREGLLATGGTNVDLTWRLAYILLRQGRLEEAEPLLRQYRRLTGGPTPSPTYYFLSGLRLLRMNQPGEAIKELEKAQFKVDSTMQAQVLYALGQAYEATRDQATALDSYEKATRLSPKWIQPRLARIQILQSNEPQQALTELELARADLPDDPALLLLRARAELSAQQALPEDRRSWERLDQALDQLRTLAPDTPGLVLLEADRLAVQGKLDEAIQRLSQAVRHDPSRAELWVAWANALLRQGQTEEALRVLQQAAAPDAAGDNATLRIVRAQLLTALNRGSEARAALVHKDENLPPDERARVWQELGNLLRQRNEMDEARKAYQHWATLAPDDPQPQLILMELALEQGDETAETQAIEALKQPRLGGPEGLFYRIAHAQRLIREAGLDEDGQPRAEPDARRLDEAEDLIERIRIDAPRQRFGYLLQGRLLELRDRPDEAIQAYEQALDYGGGQTATTALIRLYTQQNRLADLEKLRRRADVQAQSIVQLSTPELIRAGHAEAAAQLAAQLVAGDPNSLDSHLWQARVLNTLGKPEQAEQSIREAIERNPGKAAPWLSLLFFQIGQKKDTDTLARTIDQLKANTQNVEHPELLWAQCYRAAGMTEQAEAAYDAALTKWPNDANVVRAAVNFFETNGQKDKAEAELRALIQRNPAVRTDPARRWVVAELALLLSQKPKDPNAWQEAWDLVKPSQERPDTPEDRLARAIVLIRGGTMPDRIDRAATLLEELVQDLRPDLPNAQLARNLLVNLYKSRGEHEKASALLSATAAGTTNTVSIATYAESLLNAGKIDEAEQQLRRLERAAPDNLVTLKLHAMILKARDQLDEAAKVLEQAYDRKESTPEGEMLGREILGLLGGVAGEPAIPGQLETAARIGRRVAERWPAASWMLARILIRQGRDHFDEAMTQAQRAVEAARPGRDLFEAAGAALGLANAPEAPEGLAARADQVLETARQTDPGNFHLLVMSASLRHAQGNYPEEVAFYQKAREANPTDFVFLNNMAWTLSEELDRPEEALEVINDLLGRLPNDIPQFLDTRAMIQIRLDQPEKAIADLKRVVEIDPKRGVYQYHLARAYLKAGDEDAFRKHRDLARDAGLTVQDVEPSEREEMEQLMKK